MALLAVLVAAVGFWPTYFGPLLAGTLDKPAVIHVHAAVFVTWLGLFIHCTCDWARGHSRSACS
jgi:hypothetical protein